MRVLFSLCVLALGILSVSVPSVSSVSGPPTLPDHSKTPGVPNKSVTSKQFCVSGYTAGARDVPDSVKNSIYSSYGIAKDESWCKCPEGCEIDHLISLEIGGSNDPKNLWPQPYCGTWNAHMKDKLENWFHRQICSGAITVEEAQQEISSDWTKAYTKAFGSS